MVRGPSQILFLALSYALLQLIYFSGRFMTPGNRHFLIIFPQSLVALKLNQPTRSLDGYTVYLTWSESIGDPPFILLESQCGTIKIPETERSRTSDLLATSRQATPVTGILASPCQINALDDTFNPPKLLASTIPFPSFPVSVPPGATPTTTFRGSTTPTFIFTGVGTNLSFPTFSLPTFAADQFSSSLSHSSSYTFDPSFPTLDFSLPNLDLPTKTPTPGRPTLYDPSVKPPPYFPSSGQESDPFKTAKIVGGVGGSVLVTSSGGICFWRRRRRNERQPADEEQAQLVQRDTPVPPWV